MKGQPRLSVVTAPEEGGEGFAQRSDDELMLLARGGSRPAFDALVWRHQLRVLSVARRLLGQAWLASDVAQNTFLEVYRALDRYQPRGSFRSFLYRVLLNQCRMALRSAKIELRARDRLEAPVDLADDEILAREWHRDVEVALSGLSPKLRDVVLLRYSADLGYEEISDALAVPVGTVKRRLFDALARLRQTVGAP